MAALGGELVIVLAHAGHWLLSVVYAAPAVGILAWVTIATLRDRRRQAQGRDERKRS